MPVISSACLCVPCRFSCCRDCYFRLRYSLSYTAVDLRQQIICGGPRYLSSHTQERQVPHGDRGITEETMYNINDVSGVVLPVAICK